MAKIKRTNNYLKNIHIKLKIESILISVSNDFLVVSTVQDGCH
jgi:hypothetical protein